MLTRETPAPVVERMTRALRPDKVLVDRSQDELRALRALRVPSVSMPVTWDEVVADAGGDLSALFWSPAAALDRLAGPGDLGARSPHPPAASMLL